MVHPKRKQIGNGQLWRIAINGGVLTLRIGKLDAVQVPFDQVKAISRLTGNKLVVERHGHPDVTIDLFTGETS